jgi:hypothetical protein
MPRTVFRNRWLPYALVAPQMAVTVLFFFWPALKSLQLSLYRVSPFGDRSTFVGLENFQKLLADREYYASVVNSFVFAGGVTASFSMEAFTPWGGRRTRVMGSMGYIEGDMKRMEIYDFRSGERTALETKVLDVDQYAGSGHGGGDWRLAANWAEAVAKQDAGLLSSTVDVSIESHVMAFAAEHSRLRRTVESIRL